MAQNANGKPNRYRTETWIHCYLNVYFFDKIGISDWGGSVLARKSMLVPIERCHIAPNDKE